MNQPLLLGFFADAGRWHNLVRVPAYPNGYSYVQPFRYRDERVHPELIARVRDQSGSFKDTPAVICMRFSTDGWRDKVIPLRLATVTKVGAVADDYRVYFKLGSLFDFRGLAVLSDALVDLGAEYVEPDLRGVILMDVPHQVEFAKPALNDLEAQEAWINYVNLIAESENPPIHSDARNAVFVRFQTPRSHHERHVGRVRRSWTAGPLWGPWLPESAPQELAVTHRIPVLFGTDLALPAGLRLTCVSSAANLDVAPASAGITANYDTHTFTLSPLRRGGEWQQLTLSLEPETAQMEGLTLQGVEVEIPVKVRLGLWHRVWTNLVPLVLLAGALFLNSWVADYNTHHSKHPLPSWLTAVSSLAAALLIFVFKRE